MNFRLSPFEPAQIIRIPLFSGHAQDDAPEILAWLKTLAVHYSRSPYVREFVRSILPPFTGHNDKGVILRAIVDFVRDRVVYLPDPEGAEYVIDPIALLELVRAGGRAYGDCDDKALLLAAMAGSVGFETRIVGVHMHTRAFWDHVIAGVRFEGRWLDIDPCVVTNTQPAYAEKLVSDL